MLIKSPLSPHDIEIHDIEKLDIKRNFVKTSGTMRGLTLTLQLK